MRITIIVKCTTYFHKFTMIANKITTIIDFPIGSYSTCYHGNK